MQLICYSCKSLKNTKEFYKDKSRKNSYSNKCKVCQLDYRKKYYNKHKEECLRKHKIYRLQHLEELRAKAKIRQKKYYEEVVRPNKRYHRTILRFKVLQRDNFTCQYCGRKVPDVVLEVDHKNPKSNDGKFIYDNLITACQQCNNGKRDIILNEFN